MLLCLSKNPQNPKKTTPQNLQKTKKTLQATKQKAEQKQNPQLYPDQTKR